MLFDFKLIVPTSVPLVVILLTMAYHDSGRRPNYTTSCEFCEMEDSQITTMRQMFRPRGALARALYSKQLMDCQLERMDRSKVSLAVFSSYWTWHSIIWKFFPGKRMVEVMKKAWDLILLYIIHTVVGLHCQKHKKSWYFTPPLLSVTNWCHSWL
jgi:hypothetical protein